MPEPCDLRAKSRRRCLPTAGRNEKRANRLHSRKWFAGVPETLQSSLFAVCLGLICMLTAKVQGEGMQSAASIQSSESASQAFSLAGLPPQGDSGSDVASAGGAVRAINPSHPARKLIVIGFMGGNVRASNLNHREALLIKSLQEGYPRVIHAAIFANRDGKTALKTLLHLLDEDRDGHLSDDEKSAARIVIFGHSWGASETVALAGRLNQLQIPVLLTIQVDSVQKRRQNDEEIPPNVREAINYYQAEGLLRGRSRIVAKDPASTAILGNHQSSYRQHPVSCAGYPWYARAFMRRHIQIENDPAVWSQIEALILAKIL